MSVVLVEESSYRGFGYVEQGRNGRTARLSEKCNQAFPGQPETTRIIQRYLSKAEWGEGGASMRWWGCLEFSVRRFMVRTVRVYQ